MFHVYCTLSQTEKFRVNKEDFRFKLDLMWQVYFNTIWDYTLLNLFFGIFVTLSLKYPKKHIFFLWTIYIRLIWHPVLYCQNNAIFGHTKIISPLFLYFLRQTWRETLQHSLCWFIEPNIEQNSFCIFMKKNGNISKSDALP